MDKNKPTAGRTKAIHRRLELSFNLYLLLLLWVKTELSKKPPTYNPGFSASCSFSTNKTFEGQLKPSKPFCYRRFSWLPLCGCQGRNKNFCKKSPTRLSIGSYTNLSLVGLIFLFIIRVLTWLQMVLFQHTPIAWTEIHRSHVQHFYGRRPFTRVWNSCSVSTKW